MQQRKQLSATVRMVLAVLTATLALTACGPDGDATDDEASPAPVSTVVPVETSTTGYEVARTDFQVSLVLDGATLRSESIPLVSHSRLTARLEVPVGTQVDQGEVVGRRVLDPSIAASLESSAQHSRIGANLLAQLRDREGDLVIPSTGMLQEGSEGPELGIRGIDAVVNLTPIQDLRLQGVELHGSATVETVLGVREVDCVSTWVEPADVEEESIARLHCRLPASTETVPGIPVTVSVHSPLLTDVITVPNVYFGVDSHTDAYTLTYVQREQEVTTEVDVSVTDGASRVVLTDIPEGATVVAPQG